MWMGLARALVDSILIHLVKGHGCALEQAGTERENKGGRESGTEREREKETGERKKEGRKGRERRKGEKESESNELM